MSNLNKVKDVRLRGCGFTLYPAANEKGIDEELMHTLLCIINYSVSKKIQNEDDAAIEDAEFPLDIPAEDIKSFNEAEYLSTKAAFVKAGLLTEESDGTMLMTEKCLEIFEAAADKQERLDNIGFHCCPYHMH